MLSETILTFISTINTRVANIEDGHGFTGAISAPVTNNMIPFYYADQVCIP